MSKIVLPKPPSINHLYKYTCKSGYARSYISQEGKEWQEEAGWKIKQQWKRKTITTPCEIWIEVYTNRYKTQDCDNLVKPIQDILQKMGVIVNDALFYKLDIEKKEVKKDQERVEIEILGF